MIKRRENGNRWESTDLKRLEGKAGGGVAKKRKEV